MRDDTPGSCHQVSPPVGRHLVVAGHSGDKDIAYINNKVNNKLISFLIKKVTK